MQWIKFTVNEILFKCYFSMWLTFFIVQHMYCFVFLELYLLNVRSIFLLLPFFIEKNLHKARFLVFIYCPFLKVSCVVFWSILYDIYMIFQFIREVFSSKKWKKIFFLFFNKKRTSCCSYVSFELLLFIKF